MRQFVVRREVKEGKKSKADEQAVRSPSSLLLPKLLAVLASLASQPQSLRGRTPGLTIWSGTLCVSKFWTESIKLTGPEDPALDHSSAPAAKALLQGALL